jgi:hypothetical protein
VGFIQDLAPARKMVRQSMGCLFDVGVPCWAFLVCKFGNGSQCLISDKPAQGSNHCAGRAKPPKIIPLGFAHSARRFLNSGSLEAGYVTDQSGNHGTGALASPPNAAARDNVLLSPEV